jgi:hypothetical protein
VAAVHRYIGFALVTAFIVLAAWGGMMRLFGRPEAPRGYWGLQHYTENFLVLQSIIGVVFLIMGRRVVGGDLVFLHYFYGSLFPLIALVGGRIAALRREEHEYVGLAWGGFIAFGLSARALMTGCGGGVSLTCLLG